MVFSELENPPRQGIFMTSARLALKAFTIGGLTLVILIALFMINGMISSRQKYRDEASSTIKESYASSQTLIGPILVRPYSVITHTTEVDENGVKRSVDRTREDTVLSFPHELNLAGTIVP